jgi:dipeptidyl-peptidase-4
MNTASLLSLFGLLAVGSLTLAAEAEPAEYLRRHALTRGFMLGRPVQPKFTPDGKYVLFLRAEPRSPKMSLFEFEVGTGKTRELLTPEALLKGGEEHLTPEEKARRERQRVTTRGFTSYQISEDGARILVGLSGKLYVVERATGKAVELPTGKGVLVDPKFSPDGSRVGYVLNQDVYSIDLATLKETAATTGGTETVTNGLAEFVAQEEMNRFTGYWWSPDGKHIVYEQADAAGVEKWYVADPIHPEVPPHASFYPRPGKPNVKVRLGLVPVAGGKTTWIDWDAKRYEYLASVHWGKKGPLTLCVMDRLQRELLLLKADPETGKTTTLLVEKDSAFLNLHTGRIRWLKDGSFLWVAEGPRGPQLERREPDGRLRSILVGPEQHFRGLIGVDEAETEAAYRAGADPRGTHVFRLTLASGQTADLSPADATAGAVFSKDHAGWVLTVTDTKSMPRSLVSTRDKADPVELPSVAETPPFVPNLTEYTVRDGDRTFYASVIRPRDFDPARRYPVLLYVYGGPHHQQVVYAMGMYLLPQWLADQGFIVVCADNRGTPNRGRDWERAIYEKFGSVPLDDQVTVLRLLGKEHRELDLERVGVYGWSFGGYLSGLCVLRRPDVFKCAIAGAPVVDWEDYDSTYTERYLGLPETSKAAYKEANLLTYAADLKVPLLLIHGTADDNVYFRHSLRLADALFRAGRDFEILPLSGLTHLVPDPVVTQRLYGKFASFFGKHLGKPRAPK